MFFGDWASRITRLCATTYNRLVHTPTWSRLTVPWVILLEPPTNNAKLSALQDLCLGDVIIYSRNASPTCHPIATRVSPEFAAAAAAGDASGAAICTTTTTATATSQYQQQQQQQQPQQLPTYLDDVSDISTVAIMRPKQQTLLMMTSLW